MNSLVSSWWEAVAIFALVDAFLERLRSYTSYTWKLFLPRDPSTSPEAFLVYGHHPEWFSVIIIITTIMITILIIIIMITTTRTFAIVISMPKLLHPTDCPESWSSGQSQRVSRPLHLLKCWPIAMAKNAEEKKYNQEVAPRITPITQSTLLTLLSLFIMFYYSFKLLYNG